MINSFWLSKYNIYLEYKCCFLFQLVGEIHLRREPIVSTSQETKSEDIYQYGVVLRSLVSNLLLQDKCHVTN
jgi:hypothetical protein